MRPPPPRSSFSLMLWQIFRSRKTRVEVANSGKTMTFYERSELFRKYPKTPIFDHSNYLLFERIPAVPGTSNNRGLTVYLVSIFVVLLRSFCGSKCEYIYLVSIIVVLSRSLCESKCEYIYLVFTIVVLLRSL